MYEGSLCVCCMSTEELTSLFGRENSEDSNNYAQLLAACLNVKLTEDDGHDEICKPCVTKLKDCADFKKQVLKSVSILTSVDLKTLISEDEMRALNLNSEYGINRKSLEPVIKIYSPGKIIQENCINKTSSAEKRSHQEILKNLNIKVQIKPCEEDWAWEEEERKEKSPPLENVKTSEEIVVLNTSKSNEKGRKKTRGRPRIHPPDIKLPYVIATDELVCRECGEKFCNNVTLKVHYHKHFGQQQCTECSKSFMTQHSLIKHKRCHLKGPFECNVCMQVFRTINTLNSHKRFKHSGELPYRCPLKDCGQRFPTVTGRLQHLAAKHQIAHYNYQCSYCLKKFRTCTERAKHISSCHEVRYFPCPVCGVRCRHVALRAHLRAHLQGASGHKEKNLERRFACKLCSRDFTQKKTLQYHIGSHTRRGDYDGDPNFLVLDKREQKKNHGLLSEDDRDENTDDTEHSDQELQVSDEHIDKTVDDIDTESLDIEIIEENLHNTDSEGFNEICTNFSFSTPDYNQTNR